MKREETHSQLKELDKYEMKAHECMKEVLLGEIYNSTEESDIKSGVSSHSIGIDNEDTDYKGYTRSTETECNILILPPILSRFILQLFLMIATS